jgi:hypothetical protein
VTVSVGYLHTVFRHVCARHVLVHNFLHLKFTLIIHLHLPFQCQPSGSIRILSFIRLILLGISINEINEGIKVRCHRRSDDLRAFLVQGLILHVEDLHNNLCVRLKLLVY